MTDLSFEVFPPRNLDASFQLWDTVSQLAPLGPRFFSVTYGAGGSTRELTQEAAKTLRRQSGLPVAAHLTCAGATRTEVLNTARAFKEAGVRDIVALRGDPVDGSEAFKAHPDGFRNSCELIESLADMDCFSIRVGAYPESHPDAESDAQNIAWLKAKFEAGATEAITQFFFEPETFLRFRDACDKAGIDTTRLTPGILPVTNWASTKRFAARCGTQIAPDLAQSFERASRDERGDLFALVHATELCDTLMTEGVERLHFYTLNRAKLTRKVCRVLDLGTETNVRNVA
ncbi:MAG: methylenetetrahydrofolate reductase [Paracoccaceae bacterium]